MQFDISDLNIPLAISRVKRDMRDDWFADPLQYKDILTAAAVTDWFDGEVEIQPTESLNIPKTGFVIRSAREMFIHERVLYQALVDKLIEAYDPLLRPSAVYSHRLRSGQKSFIFQNTIDAWKAFNDDADALMDDDDKVIVVTDIQNYYQCIHFDRLCEQLLNEEPNSDGSFQNTILRLRQLLSGWNPDGVGLPQNRDPSSFLGNIFLRGVDEHMILAGYNYTRYMDDIRIVCGNVFEARKALQELIIKLRDYDLGVNGKKTKIIQRTQDEYRDEIPRTNEELDVINSLLAQRNVRSVRRAREMLDALADRLLESDDTHGKEFKFCINRIERLARCEDINYDPTRFVDAAIELLVDQPWSTEMLVRLLRSSNLSAQQEERVVDLALCEERNIYEWQSYMLWQLIAIKNPAHRSDEIRRTARDGVSGNRTVPFKAGSALYIGACGNSHDKRHLLQRSSETRSNMLLRSVAIATQRTNATTDRARRESVVPSHYLESTDDYLESIGTPQFFAPLPQIKASQIYDDLPCFYF
ncbi:RNA-directed DNA polymerase [Coraliomargarita sp. SDUM461003]|uniref:RNA-directed DNA polymerase n=1 Tax=Thalassobacterium maritimum TaxID=3041265 RepID=A0ABU1AY67_9BACT|nr:RNA-directed DNA polymerase [Coraliomargarita sp. SDUM461003]MDQ8209096.1 RNA-directed DNA polymerase [Coraliomargarita sp. SDUM461003]